MKMRKMVAMLMAVLMLCCIIPFSAAAESNSAAISFSDIANRVSYSTEQQVWQQNGITVTNDKGASVSNVGDYSDPARFYKSSTLTIEYPGMTAIVFDVDDYKATYTADLMASITEGEVSSSNPTNVTVMLSAPTDRFVIAELVAQVRVDRIIVYVNGETPVVPDTPVEPPVEPDESVTAVVTAPEAGVAYKLGMDQTQKGAIYYFTGAMSTYYGATDTDVAKAVDMYLENADNGYMLYFNDASGAKQYVKLVQSGTHYNFTFGAEGSVFTLDAEKNALCAPCGDQICYMGTYGSYVTVGTLTTEKLQDTDYLARLYVVTGEIPDVPVTPPSNDPAPDSTLTIAEVIALGLSKEHNVYTEGKYYTTGVITEVYNTTYGNMKIQDAQGNILTIYGTYDATGEIRYDAMDVKPVAGDTVTIYGIVGQYNGTAQIKNGWITAHTPGEGGGDTPVEPPVSGGVTITFDDTSKRTVFTEACQQWVENGIEITNNKGPSTSNVADYCKPARFYKGSQLIVTYPGMTRVEFACNTHAYATSLAASLVGSTIDSNNDKVVVYNPGGVDEFAFYLESGQVRMDSITVYTNGEGGDIGGGDTPVDPPVSGDPEPDTMLTITEVIALGLSKEHNVYTEGKYYTTGVITEVYNTTYGNMKIQDAQGNILTIYGTYDATGEVRYDALEVKPVAGDTVTIYGIVGQYNGTPQIKNGWITEHIPGEGGGDTPVVPPSDDPEPDSWLTIEEVIALGTSKEHNVYTEGKYYTTGIITEVYNTTYGNMYITDEAGNKLTIYGTYDATGEIRYDAMDVKPVAGDTVTIYGIIGQYSGNAQIKNGWIVEHTPGEGGGDTPVTPPDITDDYSGYIDFSDVAHRVSYSTEQQVWEQGTVIVTNDKGASVSNVGDYYGPARFYKSSTVTINHPGMTKIIIDCAGLESKYINGWVESITDANATASVEGQYVTIEFAQAVDSFTWVELTAQSRANAIIVWGEFGDVPPVEPDGFIEVSNDEAAAGEQVQITVSVADNPGIVSAKVKVYFDTTALQFVSVVAGNFSASGYSWSDFATVQEKGYVIINWCDAISPDSTADLLATLTFQVKEGTAEGFYDITVEFSCEDDMFNAAGDTVWFEAINGGVAVVVKPAYMPGDVNSDGKVNNRDLGQLQQFLNEYEIAKFNELAADVTGDGKVNNRDLGLLQQYLNEYDVELKYGK